MASLFAAFAKISASQWSTAEVNRLLGRQGGAGSRRAPGTRMPIRRPSRTGSPLNMLAEILDAEPISGVVVELSPGGDEAASLSDPRLPRRRLATEAGF